MSPELELQDAIVPRLKADTELMNLVNGVYDQPPDGRWDKPKLGYVTLGETQFIRDDATCIEGGDVYLTMHAWSRKVGFPAVKEIASAVSGSLHMAPLVLASWHLVFIMHQGTRSFRDPDGLTSHAVIELRAKVHKPLS
ncbi:DUF3168 domain-containing protein [Shinella sp. CPCC 101442]|uniref:DUF3168 domain-containing protein n=1 Tax=Shinella sp. CPCC 101442 TaxID=2932265 RepID=UPI002152E5BB|nr:DUF3168 domain-containing protein [Shinella sp. CPCC 101442]MCR6498414.1 DUF3168 domain-containing protein [Shinella sp. CPCC 101442]